MFGIDISNHQKGIDLSKKNFDFAIVKATEGSSFVDPSFTSHIAQLTELGKLIGCYHFARPDNQINIATMERSADHFLNTVKNAGLLSKAILVLDWEQYPTSRTDLMVSWLDRVYDNTGIKPFIYANTSFLSNKKTLIEATRYPVWAAQWPTKGTFADYPSIEWILKHKPSIVDWKIWQYTSRGKWPGFKGSVDFDYTTMTAKSWENLAFGNKEEEYISYDMEWAIEKGLFKGYSDGTYRPDDYLTRGQLATVLRRFYNTINK